MDKPPLRTAAVVAAIAAAAAAGAPGAEAAVLWDLIVTVDVPNAPLSEGQGPVVRGAVVDHAGDPVAGAAVQIRTGHGAALVSTADNGTFAHSFEPQALLPGEHRVNVVATASSNRMGTESASYRVDGDLTLSSRTAQLLATPEAMRYLSADPGGLAGDPIGMRLYDYYQGLRAQHAAEEAAQGDIDGRAAALDEARVAADNRTREALAELPASDGTLSGSRMDWFLGSLDPSIRTVVAQQINFTTGVFEDARAAMRDVLARGGSMEEARAAYLEAATVPKRVIEDLDLAEKYGAWSIVGGLNLSASRAAAAAAAAAAENRTSSQGAAAAAAPGLPALPPPSAPSASNSTAPPPPSAPSASNSTAPPPPAQPPARIQVVQSGTTIVLNINGTAAEFVVNGSSVVKKAP